MSKLYVINYYLPKHDYLIHTKYFWSEEEFNECCKLDSLDEWKLTIEEDNEIHKIVSAK